MNTYDDSKSFPRKRRHLVGLLNQGGTCYLNSLLQTLFHTPEFTYRLFNLTTRSNSSGLKSIIREMLRLFYGLMALRKYALSSKSLTDSFGWSDEQVFVHQDVQELNRLLFEEIELSLKGTVEANLINDLYKGVLSTKIQCLRCSNISNREDEYLDVNLAVIKHDSVELCLKAQTAVEKLSGENQYFCEKCNGKVDAIKVTHFKEFPPILTLCLSRFDFDPKTMESIKVDKCCSFPITLDVSEFMEIKQKQKILYDLFSILIHVGNSTLGGHYHAYIKDPYGFENEVDENENNRRDKYNSNSEKRDFSQLYSHNCNSPLNNHESNIMTKLTDQGESEDNVTVSQELDQLNMVVDIDNLSESSNQSEKKSNGKFAALFEAIKSFWTGSNASMNIAEMSIHCMPDLNSIDSPIPELKPHRAVITHEEYALNKNLSNLSESSTDELSYPINTNTNEYFDELKNKRLDSRNSNNMSSNLKDSESEKSTIHTHSTSHSKSNQSKSASRSLALNKIKFQSTSAAPKTSDIDPKFDMKLLKNEAQSKSKSYFVESGRWFDFNDESITEIKPSDFHKVFQGQECAYMLFYRNKNLVAPDSKI